MLHLVPVALHLVTIVLHVQAKRHLERDSMRESGLESVPQSMLLAPMPVSVLASMFLESVPKSGPELVLAPTLMTSVLESKPESTLLGPMPE